MVTDGKSQYYLRSSWLHIIRDITSHHVIQKVCYVG